MEPQPTYNFTLDPQTDFLDKVRFFGVFLPVRVPGVQRPTVSVVYADPTNDPRYPDGFIYWREVQQLRAERRPVTLDVTDYATAADLLADVQALSDLSAWKPMFSHLPY